MENPHHLAFVYLFSPWSFAFLWDDDGGCLWLCLCWLMQVVNARRIMNATIPGPKPARLVHPGKQVGKGGVYKKKKKKKRTAGEFRQSILAFLCKVVLSITICFPILTCPFSSPLPQTNAQCIPVRGMPFVAP